MSESDLRRLLLGSSSAKRIDLQPHEDKLSAGVPDLSFNKGWIELKYLRDWPENGAIVKIRHFTPEQRQWARRRAKAGQPCWMLLQVGEEFLLLGRGYWEWAGKIDRVGLYTQAHGYIWVGRLGIGPVVDILLHGRY